MHLLFSKSTTSSSRAAAGWKWERILGIRRSASPLERAFRENVTWKALLAWVARETPCLRAHEESVSQSGSQVRLDELGVAIDGWRSLSLFCCLCCSVICFVYLNTLPWEFYLHFCINCYLHDDRPATCLYQLPNYLTTSRYLLFFFQQSFSWPRACEKRGSFSESLSLFFQKCVKFNATITSQSRGFLFVWSCDYYGRALCLSFGIMIPQQSRLQFGLNKLCSYNPKESSKIIKTMTPSVWEAPKAHQPPSDQFPFTNNCVKWSNILV